MADPTPDENPIGMYHVTLTDALAGIDCMFGRNGCTREGCVRECYEKADAVLGVLKEFGKIE
jgi:hypothetical protein